MPKNKIRYKKIKNMAKGHCYEGVRKSIISLYENSHLIFLYIRLFCMTSDILRAQIFHRSNTLGNNDGPMIHNCSLRCLPCDENKLKQLMLVQNVSLILILTTTQNSLFTYLLNSINTQIHLKTNEQNPNIKKMISSK